MDQGELIVRLEAAVEKLESIGSDHETRLRTIESRMWYAMGVIGIILAAAPFVFKAL